MGSARLALLAIALGSGTAALIYQAVWLRWFQTLFGNTAYAASATLCAFFAGLAIGSELFGRIAARRRRPLLAYAVLEALAVTTALLVPLVLRVYEPVYATLYDGLIERRSTFVALKFALALVAMLPSALLLGGTFPLLATAYVRDPRRLGSEGVLLYAINTVGAAAGSAAGLLWLPAIVGVRATYEIGMAVSLLMGAGALLLARRGDSGPPPRPGRPPPGDPAPRPLLVIAFASGFGTLALEVLVIQALARILDHSIYSLGSVLVIVLLALAAGAAIVSITATRVPAAPFLAAALAAEAALLVVLPVLLERQVQLGLAGPGTLARGFALAAAFGGPPLLVGALVLPLTFRLAAGGSVGRRVGSLLATNTVGGILGSVAASFLLLDRLGLWISIALLGLGYALACVAVAPTLRGRLLRGAVLCASVAALLASPANPLRLPLVALGAHESLVASSEGAYGVVSVVESPSIRTLKLNNHYTLSGVGPLAARKERLGHLPLLLHPAPERALFVGSATGQTAGAAVLHPVEEIVLVEIVPEVQELAAEHFASSNRAVYQDPRTRVVIEDGRNHLRATREQYDVIVADLFSSWRPGVGSLYSQNHFEAVRARLSPRGVFCQWLPIYQLGSREFSTIAATFLDVFPNATVWRGNFYARRYLTVALVAFRGGPPSESEVERRIRGLAARGVDDRWLTNPQGFWMLYVGPLGSVAGELASAERNTDDHPSFEFLAGRSSRAERRAFVAHGWPAFARTLLRAPAQDAAPFGEHAAAGAFAGSLLARANALAVEGRPEEAGAAMRELRRVVPPELLSPPDPTVAEMWQPWRRGRNR